MALIGLNHFFYSHLTEAQDGTATHDGKKSLGKAVSCNVSITNNSAALYADDTLAESDTSFQTVRLLSESTTIERQLLRISSVIRSTTERSSNAVRTMNCIRRAATMPNLLRVSRKELSWAGLMSK